MIIVGVPLLLIIWVVSLIPPEVWIALAVLTVVLVFAFFLLTWLTRIGSKQSGYAASSTQRQSTLREAWAEAKRKTRVQSLQQKVPKLKRELDAAERELRSLWKDGDGSG